MKPACEYLKTFPTSSPTCFLISVILLVGSCAVPVNLNYDSAKMMDKGTIEFQGSASSYHVADGSNVGRNLGLKIGYGISDKYNLKLRYEYLSFRPFSSVNNSLSQNRYFYSYNFLEIDNKFKLGEKIALSLPLNYYHGPFPMFSLDPRMYFTFSNSAKFEFTLTPKAHIIFAESNFLTVMPGLSAGFGLSDDLNQWAIRPELGYDGFLSFGIGFSYYLVRPVKVRRPIGI